MIFSTLIVMLGLLLFLSHSTHYLTLLLSIEMILLGLVSLMVMKDSMPLSFLFLLLMVCSGGFSISLLVSLYRGIGKDFSSF